MKNGYSNLWLITLSILDSQTGLEGKKRARVRTKCYKCNLYVRRYRKQALYIGEAKDLVKRLLQKYQAVPHWNMFRYDLLPDELEPIRVPIERMILKAFATLFQNS